MKKYTVIRKGKPVEIDPQVPKWRKKMRKFEKQKSELLSLLIDAHGSPAKALEWLNKPNRTLGSAPPRQFLNPRQIKALIEFAKQELISSDEDRSK